jgi:hypothetical protein
MKSLSNGREKLQLEYEILTGHLERAPLDHRLTELDLYESPTTIFAVTTRPNAALTDTGPPLN